MNQTKALPDVTSLPSNNDELHLRWVGMEKIGLPIKIELSNGNVVATSALVDIFVSLDANVKGIHMSRLYLALNELFANQIINNERLEQLMENLLTSHQGISQSAKVSFSFDLPLNKQALLSGKSGYQTYQLAINHQRTLDRTDSSIEMTIPYSSTCPCSAALATELIAESIANRFPDENMNKTDLLQWLTASDNALATPHNQRSYAYIKMQMSDCQLGNLDRLIFAFENAIGTPVQTAVKRTDEQEFARLNGNNLMFCEDAARHLKQYLESLNYVSDYWFKVEHQESLHAHNAVAIDQKAKLDHH